MDSKSDVETNSKSTWAQISICLVANIATLQGGMTLGFSAVALPHLESTNAVFQITKHQASIIASCVPLSVLVGSLFAGVVMEGCGRRSALLLSCLPGALGWMTIALFPSYEGLVIGRLLTGYATGFCCNSATVFIAEGSTTKLKGYLVNGTNVGFSVGVLIVYTLGLLFKENWRLTAGLCGAVPAVAVVCILRWMPESPVWLASKGRSTQALKSLARLRSSHYQSPSIESEFRQITKRFNVTEEVYSVSQKLRAFSRPEAYKPLIIMNLFFLFQQICGTFVVIFYGVDIVREAGVDTDPFVVTALIGLTHAVFVVLGAIASRNFGKRPCAIFSGSGMTLSLVVLILYLQYLHEPTRPIRNGLIDSANFSEIIDKNSSLTTTPSGANYSWIPICALLSYILTATVGFLTLPWAMLGEVYPIPVRGFACGFSSCMTYLYNFAALFLFPTMLRHLGNKGLFTFYCVMSLFATMFVTVFLPETRNRSLAEIEEYFSGEKRRRGDREKDVLKNGNITQDI